MIDTGEVGHIGSTSLDGEGVSSIVRNHLAVLGPIGEDIVFIWRSYQCASLEVVVSTCTSRSASHCRVGYSCNLITIELATSVLGPSTMKLIVGLVDIKVPFSVQLIKV